MHKTPYVLIAGLVATGAAAGGATAADLTVSVEIPRLSVAEYHAPYVAIWVEKPDGTGAATLAVWYDSTAREDGGRKWLADVRTWWRRAGRSMRFPADGISSATRAPGRQTQRFAGNHRALRGLAPGQYVLVVEAARELGGREAVRIPFRWGAGAQSGRAAGTTELRAVTLNVSR